MVSIALRGADISGHVLADPGVSVQVGREQVTDTGDPGSCSFVLAAPDWLAIGYTDPVTVTDDDGRVRFAGWVSDLAAAHIDDPAVPGGLLSHVRVTCVGPLARWGRDRIGDEPWPQETVAERAARIAALVGQELVVQGGRDLQVIGRDVDSQPAIDVLADLAESVGGFLYDHAGTTYLQAIDVRRIPDPQERWDDQTTTWDGWDGSWDKQTGSSAAYPRSIALGPEVVLWEPAPKQTSRIANHVTVLYAGGGGQDPEQVTAQDDASIALHGRQTAKVDTSLADQADAQMRAALVLERAAYPQWHLDKVAVAWERLDPATAAAFEDAFPGIRCQVSGLPQPGPFQSFDGCIEGWTEVWAWDDDARQVLRTSTLHLSDVRWSFAVLTWDGIVPDDLPWDGIDCSWDQMLTADDLQEAAR
jgi:hypothetical protein